MYSSSVHDMPAQLQVGTVFTEGLKPERDASHPPPQISVWRGLLPRQPQSLFPAASRGPRITDTVIFHVPDGEGSRVNGGGDGAVH